MRGEPRYWFRAKRYGWGSGLPVAWQGWVVIAMYAILAAAGTALMSPSSAPARFIGYLLFLSGVLVAVCWVKGERPRWRWGKTDRS
jgi:hypothetical protein